MDISNTIDDNLSSTLGLYVDFSGKIIRCTIIEGWSASRILDITPEYASRSFKRTLVNLLAEKLVMKLH